MRMRTSPPGGVNLMALSTRLISAWRSTSSSASGVRRGRRRSTTIGCCFSSASTPRCCGHVLGQLCRSTSLARQRRLAGLGPRQREQAIDEAGQPIGLLEHAADDAAIARRSSRWPRRPTSPTLRMEVSGVRSSCETSAVNCRICSNDDSSRPSVSLNTDASRPISSSGLSHRQPIAEPFGGDRARALGHAARSAPARGAPAT